MFLLIRTSVVLPHNPPASQYQHLTYIIYTNLEPHTVDVTTEAVPGLRLT